MLLEFQERMKMGEERWSSVLRGGCVWVTHTWSGGKEHDRPGASEEGYAAFCAGCEDSERNGMRHFRSTCCTV